MTNLFIFCVHKTVVISFRFFVFRRTNILSGRGGGDRRNWISSRNSFGSQFKAKVSFLRIQADTFRKVALQKSQGKWNVTTLILWGSHFCFFPALYSSCLGFNALLASLKYEGLQYRHLIEEGSSQFLHKNKNNVPNT